MDGPSNDQSSLTLDGHQAMTSPYTSSHHSHNCNLKVSISRAPTKAKSQEPAHSQASNQNKINGQAVKIKSQAGRKTDKWMDFSVGLAREEKRNREPE